MPVLHGAGVVTASPETFADLYKQGEQIAQDLGFFLDREPVKRPGERHVGWWCPNCGQLLIACNSTGHRRRGYDGPRDCATPGSALLPLYVALDDAFDQALERHV